MTVPTTSNVVTYQGNGATTVFSFSFIADQEDDIFVYVTNSLGITSLIPDNQYALQINSPPVGGLWGLGGTVTYPLSGGTPLASGTYISIIRGVPYTQDVSIGNQGAFYPQAVEQALDVLELQIQQVVTDYVYTLKTPITDFSPPNTLPGAAQRANGILGFDANGQPIVLSNTSGGGGIIPIIGSPRRVSTTGTATIPTFVTDSFSGVSIYQSGSPVTTVQLPVVGSPIPVFDGSGNAGTYPITVLPPSGVLINGLTQFILAFNSQSATFYSDGNQILVG